MAESGAYAADMITAVLMLAMAMQVAGGDGFGQLHDEWARNLHEKRVDASVAEYAADGEFIQPDGRRVKGSSALKQLFEMITKTFDSDLKFTSVRVEVSGELAYDSGTYRETLITRATGKRQQSTGSYLTVYRRSEDGGWLIAQQVWTGAPVEDAAH
jgi:ketosteroid isomerase-like protein